MSLPEDIQIFKNLNKPELKYQIGDLVFLKSDLKKHYPMAITNFVTDEDTCSDYTVEWLNSQGVLECTNFPEECLVFEKTEE